MHLSKFYFLSVFFLFLNCSSNSSDEETIPTNPTTLYFPPISGTAWQSTSAESLGWNTSKIQPLYDFLQTGNTRAFIVLKDGKIVLEKYFGNNLANTAAFDTTSRWYWASAGKTITSLLVGISQSEGKLNINDKTSKYLGTNWTNENLTQENLITIKNQLSMTSGLDDGVTDNHCTDPSCLVYKADAGTRWAYHNAPYTLLDKVLNSATGKTLTQLTSEKIGSKIGMNGLWAPSNYDNVYYSTARGMARFGLLILNKGKWDTTSVLSDANYYNEMTTTSQNINLSYGYLWWLNGKSSSMYPGSQVVFPVSITPNAPSDMFSALGKNGQFIDVVPSKNIVVIRMGDNPDATEVPIIFHDDMWKKLSEIIN